MTLGAVVALALLCYSGPSPDPLLVNLPDRASDPLARGVEAIFGRRRWWWRRADRADRAERWLAKNLHPDSPNREFWDKSLTALQEMSRQFRFCRFLPSGRPIDSALSGGGSWRRIDQ